MMVFAKRSIDKASIHQTQGRGGFTFIELLISMMILGLLMLAVVSAISLSFQSYADTAESASAQSATRLTTQRVLRMIRTARDHAPYTYVGTATLPLNMPGTSPVESVGIRMVDFEENPVYIYWRPYTRRSKVGALYYANSTKQRRATVLLDGVEARVNANGQKYLFTLSSRDTQDGIALMRATIDLTVIPSYKDGLSVEKAMAFHRPIRLVVSATPRKYVAEAHE